MPMQDPPFMHREVWYKIIEATNPPGWRYCVEDEKLGIHEYGSAETKCDAHKLARSVIEEKLGGKQT